MKEYSIDELKSIVAKNIDLLSMITIHEYGIGLPDNCHICCKP